MPLRSKCLYTVLVNSASRHCFSAATGLVISHAYPCIVGLHLYPKPTPVLYAALPDHALMSFPSVLPYLAGARWGIKSTLLTGLSLQIAGISMLYAWQPSWANPGRRLACRDHMLYNTRVLMLSMEQAVAAMFYMSNRLLVVVILLLLRSCAITRRLLRDLTHLPKLIPM
jgi:hypothetical protein